MAGLSISRAWDETKARLAADGRLIAIVAAALVVFPALVVGVIAPNNSEATPSLWSALWILITSLVAIIGQLAIIRLAVGSAVSVGEAIAHGARRMPVYFVSGVLIVIAFLLLLIPFAAVMMALGVPMSEGEMLRSPTAMLILLLYCLVLLFFGVRLLMSSPVASEEPVGPVAILTRSWALTRGHWWRLFGFIAIFLIGAGIAIAAVNMAVSFLAALLLGPVEPMSAAALLVALVNAILNATLTAVLAVMLARIYLQLSGAERELVSVPNSGT